ncbi:MAG: DegT/DnrJ/EryC1/StrS family aminotransferase [Candidatus Brocadiia bacterium]|jgi:dTDP-4-amino-4,6-dideoxygalactose transaminase|nr:DegT/DnrJ/EryC1/StrS family aminotransferase [Candidatus Brocadiia bacterium]
MARLAVAGGRPVVPKGTIRSWPVLDATDRKAVLRVLERGIVAGGTAPEAVKLEKEWAKYCGRKFCLATNSGTAALQMALAAAQVGPGSEVITSAFTFLASASCALHQNAVPVFVDIDPRTYNMDPKKIEAAITRRTKAIIVPHVQGLMADMDRIVRVAKKHNLVVIEDAAQAHGATYKGKVSGSIGDMACFSLNNLKNFCGGEGGLLVTDDETWAHRAGLVRMFGDEVDDESQLRVYNASILGYMYRTQELPAAFARAQLRKLDRLNARRQANAAYLTEELGKIPGVIPPYVPPKQTHVYFMYNVRFNPKKAGVKASPQEFRTAVEKALYKEGLAIGQWQTMPVPAQDLFQTMWGYAKTGCPWDCDKYKGKMKKRKRSDRPYNPDDYPVAQALCESYTVVHGIHPPNTRRQMKLYVKAFHKVFDNLDVAMKHKDDRIFPHAEGSIYGVG